MENKHLPENTGDRKDRTYGEWVNEFRKMPFQFGCLGIGCLGWTIILLILLAVYWFYKR